MKRILLILFFAASVLPIFAEKPVFTFVSMPDFLNVDTDKPQPGVFCFQMPMINLF